MSVSLVHDDDDGGDDFFFLFVFLRVDGKRLGLKPHSSRSWAVSWPDSLLSASLPVVLIDRSDTKKSCQAGAFRAKHTAFEKAGLKVSSCGPRLDVV